MAANTKTKPAVNDTTADEAKTTATQNGAGGGTATTDATTDATTAATTDATTTQTAPETQPEAEQEQPVYDVDKIKRLAKVIDENLRFSLRETMARIEADFDAQTGHDGAAHLFDAYGISAKGTTAPNCLTNWGNAARRKLRQLGH